VSRSSEERCGSAVLPRKHGRSRTVPYQPPCAVGKRFKQRTIKPVFGSFAALRIAGLGARRALKPPEITSPFFNNIGQNEKVSPRFSCLIRNLAPLPLSSVACGLLPKRSPPSSELGASHSCASAPITSGPLRRRTKGPPRPQPWRNSISMKAAQAVSGARAGSQQLSLGGADASNVFHLRRTRTNAARRSAR
jgi:hypothetical protein